MDTVVLDLLLCLYIPSEVPLACSQLFPFLFASLPVSCRLPSPLSLCWVFDFSSCSVDPCFSWPAFMVASCSCGRFPFSPSRVFSPVLVTLLQGCLSGCVRLGVSFSLQLLRLRILLNGGGGGGGGIVASSVHLPKCMLSPVLCVMRFGLLIQSSGFFRMVPPASCTCFTAPEWACWSP